MADEILSKKFSKWFIYPLSGWLHKEMKSGAKSTSLKLKKRWFVLTTNSLDYYKSSERSASKLGTLVLNSLCSVVQPDEKVFKDTGQFMVNIILILNMENMSLSFGLLCGSFTIYIISYLLFKGKYFWFVVYKGIILSLITFCLVNSGYWNIIVHGRKHSYRLYTKMLNEAMRWANAIQGAIDSKVPIETPTQQLIRDIKVLKDSLDCFSLYRG